MSNGDQLPPDTLPEEATPSFAETGKQTLEGQKEGGLFTGVGAAVAAGFMNILVKGGNFLAIVIDTIFIGIAKVARAAQGEDNPQFWQLVGAIQTDLLGVEVNQSLLAAVQFNEGRLAAMQATGSTLFNLLTAEFLGKKDLTDGGKANADDLILDTELPDGSLTPEQGVKAARAFLGFAMSFAVRAANVATIAEIGSVSLLKNFREYGEEMAANLGIGRLVRLALRPLMQELIATPLEWALKKQYRPALVKEAEVVQLVNARELAAEDAHEELARQGYSDAKINALFTLHTRRPGVADLERLVRYQLMSRGDAVDLISKEGYTPEFAEFLLTSTELARVDAEQRAYIGELRKALTERTITPEDHLALLESLALTDREIKLERTIAAFFRETPHTFLTVPQIQTAFLNATIDVTELDDELRRRGYSDDDRAILRIDILEKAAEKDAAAKAKAARATKKAGRGPAAGTGRPGPPPGPKSP